MCLIRRVAGNIGIIKEQVYDKLVRDKIPEIIEANGEKPITRVLDDAEYWEYLLKKDQEELEEVREATSILERKKELADKLELICTMAIYNGFSLEDILEDANQKEQKNGEFSKRILLEKVIEK